MDCKGTNKVDEKEIIDLIYEKFDLSPLGIIKKLDLKRPIYSETCNGGHFGRRFLDNEQKIECSWERLDSVEVFKSLLK